MCTILTARRLILCFLSLTMMAVLMGCGAKAAALKPYKMEIQQGNVVTSKMLLQLRPGMTKSQVRYIMGTPLITDSFHNNRWDYFFQLRQAGKIVQQRRVILDFENELLSHVRGDVVPEGTPGADTNNAPVSKSIAKPEDKTQKDKSLLDRLKFWKKDEVPEEKPLASQPELVAPALVPGSTPAPKAPTVQPAKSAIEAAPADTQTQDGQAQDAKPPIMAVPIPLIPSSDAPIPTTPPNKPASMPSPEDSSAVQTTPIETAPIKSAPPAAVEPPAKAAPAPVPSTSPSTPARQQDKKALMLDQSLEGSASPAAAKPAAKTAPPATNTKPDTTPTASDDELDPEPGYFERLLEKIGF